MDEPTKARLRLHLRSERAMGANALPVRLPDAPAPEAARRTEPSKPASAPAPRPPASPSSRAASVAVRPTAGPTPPEAAPILRDPAAIAAGAPITGPGLPRDTKIRQLDELREQVKTCQKCRLWETRTNAVFGEGDPDAALVFVGEGPGEQEDLSGRPFVGRAGQKLDDMIRAMGLQREQVYIANIVKSRPPGNRVPAPDEAAACIPYLVRQLEIIRPKVIVTLGLSATKYLLGTNETMGRLRGTWRAWREIKVMPTFHPSYLLRSYTPETRMAVWSDLQKVMTELGLKLPKKSS